jgi:pimeloyl-ACP methyl ester carboxylesterase
MPTFATADGAELSYFENGPRGGMPILLLHGWQGAGAVWTPIVERLAARYRTIAVDLRGFGESNAAPGPYRVETFSDDLSALVASLDLDPMVVVGHSMGAAIAQRFAIDRPDAVEGLVLVAPVPASGVPFSPRVDAMFRATAGNMENANAWLSALTYTEPSRFRRRGRDDRHADVDSRARGGSPDDARVHARTGCGRDPRQPSRGDRGSGALSSARATGAGGRARRSIRGRTLNVSELRA